MKAPKPATTVSKPSFRLNYFQKFLILLGLILVLFNFFQFAVVLCIGILPSLTAIITDTKNTNKIITVGCFNLSGIIVCLHHIFIQLSSGDDFYIKDNIPDIIIMLGASAFGFVIYYTLPDIFAIIWKKLAQHRLKVIDSQLSKYTENWSNILPNDRE